MNWLDVVLLICLVSGFVKGLFDGLVKQVVSLVALVLAFVFSGTLADVIRNTIEVRLHWGTSFSPATMHAIYYIISFIVIVSLFGLLAKFVDQVINYTPVGAFNRLGGGAFGLVMCLLCLSFVLNILAAFNVESKVIHKETQEKSVTYMPVKMALPVVYPYIREFFQATQEGRKSGFESQPATTGAKSAAIL
jgi:membrane protein required for colicin V production